MATLQARDERLCLVNLFFSHAPSRARSRRTLPTSGFTRGSDRLAGSCNARTCRVAQVSQVEEVLEAHGEPGPVADRAEPGQHAGRERRPVQRVVPDRERLPHAAEHDLLVGDQAADPQAVHVDPVHGRRRGRRPGRSTSRRAPAAARPRGGRPRSARRYAARCRTARPPCRGGAARPPRPTRRTARPSAANRIISTAPIEKLGAISTPTSGASASQPLDGRQPVVVEAGGADHRVDAVVDAELEVVHDRVGVGEVHDRLRPGLDQGRRAWSSTSRAATSSRSSAAVDGAAHLGADLALRPEHADPSYCVTASNLAVRPAVQWCRDLADRSPGPPG